VGFCDQLAKMSRIFHSLVAIYIAMNVGPLHASERLLQVEGSAFRTSEISDEVFRSRAISNALQSVTQSGAQSVESFAIVENGKVLIDQIANKSNINIAGYRVLETRKEDNKFFVRLEVLVLDVKSTAQQLTCRRPSALNIQFTFTGLKLKTQFPYWFSLNEIQFKKDIRQHTNLQENLNLVAESQPIKRQTLSYGLYETNANDELASPQITPSGRLSLSLEADITSKSDFLQSKKDMTVEAKSTLYKNNAIVSSASQIASITIEESNFLSLKSKSSKDRLDHIKAKIMEISLAAIDKATAPLECQNIVGKTFTKNGKIFFNFGEHDGLLESDIFVSTGSDTSQYYFKVKKLTDNTSELIALSDVTNTSAFANMDIRILERF
jgi:hypothetical protein